MADAGREPIIFPEGFLFGTATAAYQIEGSVSADGRGVSIWDTFSHRDGATRNGDNGDVASDHYRRLNEDLDLLRRLGAPSYRFSIAWPRIQPTGKGPFNKEGVDFYRRLVGGLRDREIEPAATLYHWDLPQPLEDAGGWAERDTVERFAEYAEIVAEQLGDEVGMWITLNEPWCSAWAGYGQGRHAPGITDIGKAVAATHHLLLAHGQAVRAVRAVTAKSVKVGITLNLTPVRAASEDEADRAAARRVDGNMNRLFLEPVFKGSYPADMLEHYAGAAPGFSVVMDGDLQVIAEPIDFLGVNYYSPRLVASPEHAFEMRAAGYYVGVPEPDLVSEDLVELSVLRPGVVRTEMDWEIEPGGLTELLERVQRDYRPGPIYITENGGAFDDYVDPDGCIRDPERVSYLEGHLKAVAEAIEKGIDVRGYFVWSLLDNFEWGYGFAKRFGLVWVDYPTGTRTPKDSFWWYRDLIAANERAVTA